MCKIIPNDLVRAIVNDEFKLPEEDIKRIKNFVNTSGYYSECEIPCTLESNELEEACNNEEDIKCLDIIALSTGISISEYELEEIRLQMISLEKRKKELEDLIIANQLKIQDKLHG